jgi:hypothetical protein
MDRRSLNYLLKFDQEAGMFLARSPANPLITGEGTSLYVAIDNLEAELSRNSRRSGELNTDLLIRQRESEVEVTCKNLNSSLDEPKFGASLACVTKLVMNLL